jgi:lysylphosphatidylglycerol synthetase-like protein (DUF2156 family)
MVTQQGRRPLSWTGAVMSGVVFGGAGLAAIALLALAEGLASGVGRSWLAGLLPFVAGGAIAYWRGRSMTTRGGNPSAPSIAVAAVVAAALVAGGYALLLPGADIVQLGVAQAGLFFLVAYLSAQRAGRLRAG